MVTESRYGQTLAREGIWVDRSNLRLGFRVKAWKSVEDFSCFQVLILSMSLDEKDDADLLTLCRSTES